MFSLLKLFKSYTYGGNLIYSVRERVRVWVSEREAARQTDRQTVKQTVETDRDREKQRKQKTNIFIFFINF